MTNMKAMVRNLIPISGRARAKAIYFSCRRFGYLGDRVECPCCRRKFRCFAAYASSGSGGREVKRLAAQCPGCGALERHRLLAVFLEQRGELLQGGGLRILHVAPEPFLRDRLRGMTNIQYFDADLYDPTVKLKIDILETGLPDGAFDAVICNHVLEHVVDDRRAAREIQRILKTGGWAIMQVPQDPDRAMTYENPAIVTRAERIVHFGQEDHLRIFGADYPQRLRESGFAVETISPQEKLSKEHVAYFGLDPREQIFLCRKMT